jgi:Calcineurin-like phosphoesterase
MFSGNHDNAGGQVSRDRAPVYEWLFALGREPKIVTEGVTQVVSDLIITTLPYRCSNQQKSVLMDRGAIIRLQRGSPWVVLHHIPPLTYPGSGKEGAEAAELLQVYRPDYFVSGHSHQFPYFPGSTWSQRIDRVTVLTPGQLMSAPFPNHMIEFSVRRGELENGESGVNF